SAIALARSAKACGRPTGGADPSAPPSPCCTRCKTTCCMTSASTAAKSNRSCEHDRRDACSATRPTELNELSGGCPPPPADRQVIAALPDGNSVVAVPGFLGVDAEENRRVGASGVSTLVEASGTPKRGPCRLGPHGIALPQFPGTRHHLLLHQIGFFTLLLFQIGDRPAQRQRLGLQARVDVGVNGAIDGDWQAGSDNDV